MSTPREHWGSRFGFILAAAGSAVGLGNIWKYPHMAGQNGGGAFTLVYLICILVVGLPILLAELSIGRRTQLNPVGAFKQLGGNSAWKLVGFLGVASAVVILSFYSVVGGWVIKYVVLAVQGAFADLVGGDRAGEIFKEFSTSPIEPLIWHLIFMGLCVFIIARGVKGGIERWSKILMPLLLVILLILVVRGITLPGAMEGIRFLFSPKWSDLDAGGVVLALGHAFFTISLGMGTMITYGSYLRRDSDLVQAGLLIVFLDTLIALLAGVAIFTAVFALGQNPAAGPGLIFVVLPAVFSQMPGGSVFGFLFFALLLVAALTSAISILEVATAYLIDELKWSRTAATLLFGGFVATVGVLVSLSQGDYNILAPFGDLTFFDLLDMASSKYMLPLGGLLTALFVLFRWGVPTFLTEVKVGSEHAIGSRIIAWLEPTFRMEIKVSLGVVLFLIAGSVVAYLIFNEIVGFLSGLFLA